MWLKNYVHRNVLRVFKTESSALITKSQEACQKKQEPQNVKEKHIQSLLGGLSLFFKGLLSPIFFFFFHLNTK